MTNETTPAGQSPIKFDRTYDAPVEDLWDLWTTKEGLESWWGPEGFRIDVHKLDLRVGGELRYDMIAVGAEEIEYMKKSGMGVSHDTRGTFVEIEPLRRLKVLYMIDFLPGVKPYENNMLVEFFPEGTGVRMVITVDPHPDETFTQMAAQGWESQLTKLPAALAAWSR
ncbi:MAG: SRPBCC family protein [Gemmatimonadota bacterium]